MFHGQLLGPGSMEALVPLLQAQDHDPAFRDIVLAAVTEEGGRPDGSDLADVRVHFNFSLP